MRARSRGWPSHRRGRGEGQRNPLKKLLAPNQHSGTASGRTGRRNKASNNGRRRRRIMSRLHEKIPDPSDLRLRAPRPPAVPATARGHPRAVKWPARLLHISEDSSINIKGRGIPPMTLICGAEDEAREPSFDLHACNEGWCFRDKIGKA